MFETSVGTYSESQRTEIDPKRRIRKICLRLSDKKSGRKIWGLRFVDDNGRNVINHSWNKEGKWVAQALDSDEEIVGVYGKLNEASGIRSLGFIVWRNTDWSNAANDTF